MSSRTAKTAAKESALVFRANEFPVILEENVYCWLPVCTRQEVVLEALRMRSSMKIFSRECLRADAATSKRRTRLL